MARAAIWTSISETLGRELAQKLYRPGDKLPTEAELAARFGVNRHTVRRAIADLAERGLVFSRRGAGVFVAQAPTDYPIGRRVRFHQNLRAAGQTPGKVVLSLETRIASSRERAALEIDEDDPVHVYEGLSLSDGLPVALFRSVFPAGRFPGLLDILRNDGSVTRALAQYGIHDYTRSTTRLTAKIARATQALQLQIAEGAPILRSVGINVDTEGAPLEFGTTWFAGDRVTLTLADKL